jgi:serine protease
VGIGAPGGNCVNQGGPCLFSITAAVNAGATTPGASIYTDKVTRINVGTSFSAPLVAGAAALIHSINSQLSPAQYIALLTDSATPFPTSSSTTSTVCHVPIGDTQNTECICTTQTCGAGMLNTNAAVLAAQRPLAVADAPNSITAGVAVDIDARASFASNGHTIASYQWTAIGVTGATPVFGNTAQPLTTVQVSGDSTFTLRLTVTDNLGAQDTADVAMATPAPPAPPVTPPASAPSGGGGGGGSLGWLMIGLLGLAISASRRARSGTG